MQIKQFWIFYYKFLAKVGKKDTYPNMEKGKCKIYKKNRKT
jgi:hypothetical protein